MRGGKGSIKKENNLQGIEGAPTAILRFRGEGERRGKKGIEGGEPADRAELPPRREGKSSKISVENDCSRAHQHRAGHPAPGAIS